MMKIAERRPEKSNFEPVPAAWRIVGGEKGIFNPRSSHQLTQPPFQSESYLVSANDSREKQRISA
jgi:hypothetical protein